MPTLAPMCRSRWSTRNGVRAFADAGEGDRELVAIADSMNTRPRQTLDWNTPLQTFALALANTHRAPGSIQ